MARGMALGILRGFRRRPPIPRNGPRRVLSRAPSSRDSRAELATLRSRRQHRDCEWVQAPVCTCPKCGDTLSYLGEDVTEVLEYGPASFRVIRHVRPKQRCRACAAVVQAPAAERPIARGLAGPGLLAHVLVAKYCDHLPLYRQAQIYAREGVAIERSTLADWVGAASALLAPLGEALERHVLGGASLHADDTPVPGARSRAGAHAHRPAVDRRA